MDISQHMRWIDRLRLAAKRAAWSGSYGVPQREAVLALRGVLAEDPMGTSGDLPGAWTREDRDADLPPHVTPPERVLREHRSPVPLEQITEVADECARLGRECARLEAKVRSLLLEQP